MHAPEINVNDDKAWSVPIRAGLAAKAHRTTGHAAEMAFFAVLTLVPSTVAVGSALGLSQARVRRGHGGQGRGRRPRGGAHADGAGARRQRDHAVRARPARAAAQDVAIGAS